MKRGFGLSLILAAMLFADAARAEDSCTKIVATGHPDYPVMAYKDGSLISGAAPLLIGEIAEKLQIPFESRYMGSWSDAQSATRAGDADMISMCRPLIREPDLIARWRRGDTEPVRCLSCNKCFQFGVRGEPLECAEERRLREEATE